jgi:hypothetical protein
MTRGVKAFGALTIKAVAILAVATIYLAVSVGLLSLAWFLRQYPEPEDHLLAAEAEVVRVVEGYGGYPFSTRSLDVEVAFSANGKPARATISPREAPSVNDRIDILYDPAGLRRTVSADFYSGQSSDGFGSIVLSFLLAPLAAGAVLVAGVSIVREMSQELLTRWAATSSRAGSRLSSHH